MGRAAPGGRCERGTCRCRREGAARAPFEGRCSRSCDVRPGGGTRVCLSDDGGRCQREVDCKGCYRDGTCGTCVDGRCLG